jgi:hypothetical protein
MNDVNAEDIELYDAYFGRSSDYYLEKLERAKIHNKITFNPYALLLGLFWFIYRKLWLEFLLIAVILVVLKFNLKYFFNNKILG